MTYHQTTRVLSWGFILTLALSMYLVQTTSTLDTRKKSVCPGAYPLLKTLDINETELNETGYIEQNVADNEVQHLKKVCQVVVLHALGDSSAGEVVRKACNWIYNRTMPEDDIPQCEEELSHFCFRHSRTNFTDFSLYFGSFFKC